MKTAMMFILLTLISGLFFYGYFLVDRKYRMNGPKLDSEVFAADNGFGYTITYEGKTLIKQNNIPAMEELKSFCSRNDALKVANLVIKKLEGNKPPTISLNELIALQIRTNCSKQSK